MAKAHYDVNSAASIYEYSVRLTGKSLSEVVKLPPQITNSKNRGDLGSLIEKYFFEHTPPNTHEPDFAEAGLELKTTGILDYKRVQKTGELLRAKERMTLTNINFKTLEFETWESSSLVKKCNLMLILFYKYDNSVSVVEQYFELQPLLLLLFASKLNQKLEDKEFIIKKSFKISDSDLEIIRRDWEFIRQKVAEKKAHELSEGDTFYLGACRKGSGKEDEALKKQIGSDIGAKSRAFCFKQNFLSKLVQGHSKNEVSLGIGKELTFEVAIKNRFKDFLGMTVEEISANLNYFTKSKSEKWLLSRRILTRGGKSVEEFEKAEIQLKTVSLSKSGGCREDMSFPAFVCNELANQDWEDSDFSFQVEAKFLFVVFKEDKNGKDRLEKVMYWNMPYEDRLEAKRVWEEAKRRLLINARDLPKRRESKVAHVRPHAKNKDDVDLTPQGELLVKRCFWLNGSYIAKIVS